jgi:hypothetical protein
MRHYIGKYNNVHACFYRCYCSKEIGRGKRMALVEMGSTEEAVQALVVSLIFN